MPLSEDPRPIRIVDQETIRQIFNEGRYFERAQSGELRIEVPRRDKHKDPPPEGEPICTRSQMVYYYTQDDELVSVAHQYLRPDDTIGASGRPDPKSIFTPEEIIQFPTSTPEGEPETPPDES